MNEQNTNDWPTHRFVLSHHLSREQFLDLIGKTSLDWLEKYSRKHQVAVTEWGGENSSSLPSEREVEIVELELIYVGWASMSYRNDEIMVHAAVHRPVGSDSKHVLVGDGRLFVNGTGYFVVRAQLVSRAELELFSEIFGNEDPEK